ncbi:hypothetical protein G1H11_14300 [Phytoactinopolyspora alkaliphila]|uniref:Uncharacterized protein n=1 Tax=Phytoactinopolyspora alkaliphila TaxID=1783498 RepID=A0A6N9YNR2_9ACTN|nr:hypothetical protein [Phytoactinopolyspora alkaliphila]NED96478.1 hypothetical protein [Phytoactinopolyspora alkaliphila]
MSAPTVQRTAHSPATEHMFAERRRLERQILTRRITQLRESDTAMVRAELSARGWVGAVQECRRIVTELDDLQRRLDALADTIPVYLADTTEMPAIGGWTPAARVAVTR